MLLNLGCVSNPFIQSNHGTIEELGLDGTFKGHPVQSPCNEQGHLQLDEVANPETLLDSGNRKIEKITQNNIQ